LQRQRQYRFARCFSRFVGILMPARRASRSSSSSASSLSSATLTSFFVSNAS